jgi:hypothetical protein
VVFTSCLPRQQTGERDQRSVDFCRRFACLARSCLALLRLHWPCVPHGTRQEVRLRGAGVN